MTQREFLSRVLGGNESAVAFCERAFRISQNIDDLYDGDKVVDDPKRDALIWDMLVGLPDNPFYQAHFDTLQPLIRAALSDWIDSTTLESGDDHEVSLAFVLRDQLTGVVSQCAYLVGGYQHMRNVSVEIRRHFHNERLDDYQASLQERAP
ncbi:hypothetical protein V5738_10825 [Salinisphaera sp. SPP-AMP-43]|uniref:hypothetical protein n=1 Tax=Salinisphaera sp. SPP-AMP-43 TaxID=3121288 RepID=UPI003C6E1D0C